MRRAVAGLALVFIALPAAAWASGPSPAERGATWLISQQHSDGSFSGTSPAGATGETLAAIVAGGAKGTPVDKALAYLRTNGKAGATEGAYTGRIIAGIVAGAQNPRSFGDNHDNYVTILHSQYNTATGAYDPKNFFSDLIAANGANAARDPLPAAALAYIDTHECPDGGFPYSDCAAGSDVDTTAWAINVLVASGHRTDQAVSQARSYLLGVQRSDGGFASSSSPTMTSSDSTGLAIAAINALGEDATSSPWKQSDGDDPVKALVALQTSSGSFRPNNAASGGSEMSTVNAVPGLAHRSYPVLAPTAQPTPTPTPQPTRTSRGGGGGATNSTSPPSSHGSTSVAPAVATPYTVEVSTPRHDSSSTTGSRLSLSPAGPAAKPKPTPYLLGFGGISTKPGGLSMAMWGAIAAGCTGLGVGIWFLRLRLR